MDLGLRPGKGLDAKCGERRTEEVVWRGERSCSEGSLRDRRANKVRSVRVGVSRVREGR